MQAVTYPEELVGSAMTSALLGEALPDGYRHVTVSQEIGEGRERFEVAAEMLMTWEMHRGAGLRVDSAQLDVTEGSAVRVTAGWGPLRAVAPCVVVRTVRESDVVGFAYGTLPGHPECGEEAFVIALRDRPDAQPEVRFAIAAFSRPARWWSKLGGPVNHRLQDVITQRYVSALQGTR